MVVKVAFLSVASTLCTFILHCALSFYNYIHNFHIHSFIIKHSHLRLMEIRCIQAYRLLLTHHTSLYIHTHFHISYTPQEMPLLYTHSYKQVFLLVHSHIRTSLIHTHTPFMYVHSLASCSHCTHTHTDTHRGNDVQKNGGNILRENILMTRVLKSSENCGRKVSDKYNSKTFPVTVTTGPHVPSKSCPF